MDNMTLVDILSKRLDIPREETMTLMEGLGKCLGECGSQLDVVALPGFGTFEPKKRLERVALHPASGKRLLVPPKIVINFRPTAALKQRVNNGE